ncbi:uncharacterized protein LOC131941519 [Physella acuta]|uniref:uncharacterized protein LOC131941519 n=1 Tax=Physella acuta TaxID=109671 RepID=UPI0027DBFC41|nr:uncharacterized protein LOC131941519 [Physella acuta]
MPRKEQRYVIADDSDEETQNPLYIPVCRSWQKSQCKKLNLPFVRTVQIETPKGPQRLRDLVPFQAYPEYGDGNCLFRCLSRAVTGSSCYHEELRELIVRHICRNAKKLSVLLPESFQDNPKTYIADCGMRYRGTWGSDVEIMAAAHLLKTKIFVYTKHGETWQWAEHNLDLTSPESKTYTESIYLMHTRQVHYDLVAEMKSRYPSDEETEGDPSQVCQTSTCKPKFMSEECPQKSTDRRNMCKMSRSAAKEEDPCRSTNRDCDHSVVKYSTMHENGMVRKTARRQRFECTKRKIKNRSSSRPLKRKGPKATHQPKRKCTKRR